MRSRKNRMKGRYNIMKRKFLEELGLEKGTIDSIMNENGKDIEAAKGEVKNLEAKVSTLESENASLKTQVSERDAQLETLKNSTGDVEAMKQQIATLQADNKAKDEAHAAEIKQMKIDTAIDNALGDAKAKNKVAVKALLKDLDKAELAEDGTIKGLSEQIKALQKSDSYLFEVKGTKSVKGAKPGESGNDDGDQGVDTSKMSYSELVAYLAENPDVQI